MATSQTVNCQIDPRNDDGGDQSSGEKDSQQQHQPKPTSFKPSQSLIDIYTKFKLQVQQHQYSPSTCNNNNNNNNNDTKQPPEHKQHQQVTAGHTCLLLTPSPSFMQAANCRSSSASLASSRSASKQPASFRYLLASLDESVEIHAQRASTTVIVINVFAILANVVLALVAFYYAFACTSSALSAFAADCILDCISSAILLWRFYGDLSDVYLFAREQIACVYMGALFLLSSLAILVEAIHSLVSTTSSQALDASESSTQGDVLVRLAIVASVAMSVLTIIKTYLYFVLKDKAILLDVINSFVSTIFALSILVSRAVINTNPHYWYLDQATSILLAAFMALFGLQVLYKNIDVLNKPKASFFIGNNNNKTTEVDYNHHHDLYLLSYQASQQTNNTITHHILDSLSVATHYAPQLSANSSLIAKHQHNNNYSTIHNAHHHNHHYE